MQASASELDNQRPRVLLAQTPHSHKLPSPVEMAAYDTATIAAGVEARELMERAGQAIYAAIAPRLRARRHPVVVLCGPGNNGGDGLVIARQAALDQLDVSVVMITPAQPGSLSAAMESKLAGTRVKLVKLFEGISVESLAERFGAGCVVIDALLGTGQSEAPRGLIADLLALCQRFEHTLEDRIAVDLPSGVNSTTGQVYSPCFHATTTVTVELIKRGMLQYPARSWCGDIVAVSATIDCTAECEYSLITPDVLDLLPARAVDSHKGDAGSVLVAAGSKAMPGAAALSARAALRCGAGRVYRLSRTDWAVDSTTPEIIYRFVGGNGQTFTKKDVMAAIELGRECDALVIGPGITIQPTSAKFTIELLKQLKMPAVIDADALNLLAALKHRREWPNLKGCIITPHPGEAAKLLGCSIEQINSDRFTAASKLAQMSSAVVVLKGAGTLVYAKKQGWLCDRGTPYLGTAGSGDVLAGLLAALLAKGLQAVHAALLGVYLHALAGELAVAESNGPIIASDIVARLPGLLGARVNWRGRVS